ncbi:MAG: hypothetical protein KGO02_25975 [Alphaproteobacteria bacterium]|nr:hypothetical protein [Alphaproteobacteria bacterium]
MRESLLQILKGIKEAQVITNRQGAGVGVINPKWGNDKDYADYMQHVEFDIAVSAATQKAGGGGASLKVIALDVGGDGQMKVEKGTVSRVSFRLPVAFPAVTITDVPPRARDTPE